MKYVLNHLPPMLSGNELLDSLTVLPEYNEEIRSQNESLRLIALSDLYDIYLPSSMSTEIYCKLYLALLRSLQKKNTNTAIKQHYENYKTIKQLEHNGIIGGSDSFTIIGTSGIGKSSAINRCLNLITHNEIIETTEPYSKIIPCIVVQCPFDSSVKGLLLEILRKVDEEIGSNYYTNALRVRATTDMLIGSVSQVALNHIGVLVVDEIQNVVNSKNGKILIGSLTQLINNSGISICMVGTPESSKFFEQAIWLARRTLGLQYNPLPYNEYFYKFCTTVFSYQYTKNKTEITDSIINWLYEHSGGVISVVISLIHDAQEIAIIEQTETLNIETLIKAYKKRLSMMHKYIEPTTKQQTAPHKVDTIKLPIRNSIEADFTIAELVSISKSINRNVIDILKENIIVEEITV